jgi:hypothetical protein
MGGEFNLTWIRMTSACARRQARCLQELKYTRTSWRNTCSRLASLLSFVASPAGTPQRRNWRAAKACGRSGQVNEGVGQGQQGVRSKGESGFLAQQV